MCLRFINKHIWDLSKACLTWDDHHQTKIYLNRAQLLILTSLINSLNTEYISTWLYLGVSFSSSFLLSICNQGTCTHIRHKYSVALFMLNTVCLQLSENCVDVNMWNQICVYTGYDICWHIRRGGEDSNHKLFLLLDLCPMRSFPRSLLWLGCSQQGLCGGLRHPSCSVSMTLPKYKCSVLTVYC